MNIQITLVSLLIVILLLTPGQSTATDTITISDTYTFPITHTDTQDTCFQIYMGQSTLYHLNTQSIFEKWRFSSPNSPTIVNLTQTRNITAVGFTLISNEWFLNILNARVKENVLYSFLFSTAPAYTSSAALTRLPSQLIYISISLYYFYRIYQTTDALKAAYSSSLTHLNSKNGTIAISPNGATLVVWDPDSTVYIYSANTLSLLHTIAPQVNVTTYGATNQITFNSASTLIIIETDQFNPVLVMNLSDYSIYFSVNVAQEIYGVTFFGSSNKYILVLGVDSSFFVDTSTGVQYPQTVTQNSEIISTGFNNKVFICKDNNIIQYTITVTTPSNNTNNNSNSNSTESITNGSSTNDNSTNDNSTNNNSTVNNSTVDNSTTNNTTNSSNNNTNTINNNTNSSITNDNSSNQSSPHNSSTSINPQQFYLSLNYSALEKQLNSGIGSGMTAMMSVANKLTAFSTSTPFTVYFLAFLNYFTLSSMYILLNYPLPQQVYSYLSTIFNTINTNIFSLAGFNVGIAPISAQKVNRNKPLYFGASSDVLSTNFPQFLMVTVNFLVLLLWRLAFVCFSRLNSFKKAYNETKSDMIHGQIVSILASVTLPWSFVLLQNGVHNFASKINIVVSIFFFFLACAYPVFYMYCLIVQRKHFICQYKRKQNKEFNTLTAALNGKPKKDNPKRKAATPKLITSEMLGKWFLCSADSVYPFLVLLENPLYFLTVILIFTASNLIVELKSIKQHTNSFVLSLYPFIFHVCFIIFYFSTSVQVLICAEIACLLSLLLGGIHNSVTIIVEMLYYLYTFIKRHLNGKVANGSICQRQTPSLVRQTNKTTPEMQLDIRIKYVFPRNHAQKEIKQFKHSSISNRQKKINQLDKNLNKTFISGKCRFQIVYQQIQ